MLDFFKIKERSGKKGVIEIYPDFKVCRSKDLMIRGKSFYAIWDEEAKIWSTDEYDVQRLVDHELYSYADRRRKEQPLVDDVPAIYKVQAMGNFTSRSWLHFRNYVGHLTDNSTTLDDHITFANTEVKKEDYVSKRLSYGISQEGSIGSWLELIGTLYTPGEREKLEWAIGAIISGDARFIQKFIVLYGSPGSGKGTLIGILEDLFDGYIAAFNAKDLTSGTNQFATEPFRGNPLVAIDHDGDLSRIADNTRLNSIVSHETILVNEKNKPTYAASVNAFLFIASNTAVKITDAKSGIIRRLIDVQPSGVKVPVRKYNTLLTAIQFELGAIAWHCLEVYRKLGRHHYDAYTPIEMMLQTDVFFNFVEDNFEMFTKQDGVALSHAFVLYKDFLSDSLIEYNKLTKLQFREELKNYFREYHERYYLEDGSRVRSYYSGFRGEKFDMPALEEDPISLVLDQTESIFDRECASAPAQYSNANGAPRRYWDDRERLIRGEMRKPDPDQIVDTILSDIDTSQEHYVKPGENHIVIDFDIKGEDGAKSMQKNLEAAAEWPATYAEFSKSGAGVHLHYIYDGDTSELSRVFGPDIEIKVFNGNSSLRRRLSLCNNIPIRTISGGLPVKEKKVANGTELKSEKGLRDLLDRNLRKEIMPGTKPSMDFIKKILDDAYESELQYDVSDYMQKIIIFANNSTNQAEYCLSLIPNLKLVGKVNYDPETIPEQKTPIESGLPAGSAFEKPIAIFDVEVFPNVLIVCWSYEDSDTVVRMIQPSPEDIAQMIDRLRLIGFNNRDYDNHILYARRQGFNNRQLYNLSKAILAKAPNCKFAGAYGLSYADIFDYAAKKQSLKKWQVELGITHMENHHDWDADLPEEFWEQVTDYCENDVRSTKAVREFLAADFIARQILADLSGLTVNDKTNNHSARIILEGDRDAQSQFEYVDLSEDFPGYTFDPMAPKGEKSYYHGFAVGEGGFVYEETGYYENVAVLDVASMHPASMIAMNAFGKYTKNLEELVKARIAIKHKDYELAGTYFNGALKPYLTDEKQAKALSYALKIVINSVYGLTSASYDNPFRNKKNNDNYVAKRGALFMIDLMLMVQDLGYQVVHIKTDSIKIPNADDDIIQKVMDFGKEYGYDFEHEKTYSKFLLTTKADYIAYDPEEEKWDAVGDFFGDDYTFNRLFSTDGVDFEDLRETKSVTTAMYGYVAEDPDTPMVFSKDSLSEISKEDCKFLGKVGSFVAVDRYVPGAMTLLVERPDTKQERGYKFDNVNGGRGLLWLDADEYRQRFAENDIGVGNADINTEYIDLSPYEARINKVIETVNEYVDFEQLRAVS